MTWCDRTLVRAPYYALCLSKASFHRQLKHIGVKRKDWPEYIVGEQADATTFTFELKKTNKLCCVVTMRAEFDRQDGIEVAALLVHEGVHIWQKTKAWLGEYDPSKEFEAYAIQNIAAELMRSYATQTKRRRRK